MPLRIPSSAARAARVALRVLAALSVVLLALEMTARVAFFGLAGLDPRKIPLWSAGTMRDYVQEAPERRILFEHKPNLDLYAGLARIQTNSLGMRDREYPLEKPPGAFRVAVIGSSFSVPAGVAIEDAYHSVLEERLGRELSPTPVEFLNFAVGMHVPVQFVAMIQHRALRFDPDLIIVSVTDMSVRGMFRPWNAAPNRKALDALPGGPRSFLLTYLQVRFSEAPKQRRRSQEPTLPSTLAGEWDVITKLGRLSRATGIPIVVFRIAYEPFPVNEAERLLEERVRATGLDYFDSRDAFAGTDPRTFRASLFDPHPNAAAHAILADALGRHLDSRGLLPRR